METPDFDFAEFYKELESQLPPRSDFERIVLDELDKVIHYGKGSDFISWNILKELNSPHKEE